MKNRIVIEDRQGNIIKAGNFTEPEMRMAAKAGYRVFEDGQEVTQGLTGLFDTPKTHGME